MSVVIVGGNDHMATRYQDICKQYKWKSKVFTQLSADFENKIGEPDLLVVFTSTCSHGDPALPGTIRIYIGYGFAANAQDSCEPYAVRKFPARDRRIPWLSTCRCTGIYFKPWQKLSAVRLLEGIQRSRISAADICKL